MSVNANWEMLADNAEASYPDADSTAQGILFDTA